MPSRTLIIAPPSVAAHPEQLNRVYETHSRAASDLQMLDRIAAGLVARDGPRDAAAREHLVRRRGQG